MKVIVVGAGVIGVTSAWYLARAGHEVVVLDRQSGPALEASFANAGEVSFGYCSPWAAPGIPLKAMRWLMMEHAPLVLRPKPDAAMLRWLLAMLGNCTSERYAINKSRMLRLADYSRVSLAQLRDDTAIQYDQRFQGTLQLFRKQEQLDAAGKDMKALAADRVPYRLLTVEECIAVEPALAYARDRIVGGLQTPLDETGDCQMFTAALEARAAAIGVQFRYREVVTRLVQEGGAVSGVVTAAGAVKGDAVLVAAGSFSPALVRSLGLRLPVYPVKGYSLTLPINKTSCAPESTVMDETYKIAITRLGDRIRVGGMAEISGFTADLPDRRRNTLEYSVTDLFPGGDLSRGRFWSGLRPMTPDGTPVIGATPIRNLYLNTGHGTLGWTMSTGSGRLISQIISSEEPDISTHDLSYSRYIT